MTTEVTEDARIDESKLVNGKFYPMWQDFVDKQGRFKGWLLLDEDDSFEPCVSTFVVGISLRPNGETSAFFEIEGEDYGCGADVSHLGMNAAEGGGFRFYGYGGHTWTMTPAINEDHHP